MRILLVSAHQQFGGSEQSAVYLMQALKARGHTVDRVCYYASSEASDTETIILGKKRRFPLPRVLDYLNPFPAYRLLKEVRRLKPDVINVHNVNDYAFSLFTFLFLKKYPVVWTVHDWWAQGGFSIARLSSDSQVHASLNPEWGIRLSKPLPFGVRFIERKIAKLPRLTIVTPTKWIADSYAHTPLAALPFETIPLGIDTSTFIPRTVEPPGPPIVLYIGRPNERKGFDVLKKAMETVCETQPDAELWAVGSHGPDVQEGHVRLFHTRKTAELPEFLRKASVFVSPGVETPGLAALEAIASGVPTVASDIPPVREYVNDDVAELYHYHDELDLADRILRILTDPGRRRAMTEKGPAFIDQHCSHRQMAERYEELFMRLVQAPTLASSASV